MNIFLIRAVCGAAMAFTTTLALGAPAPDVTVNMLGVRPGGGMMRAVLCTRIEQFPTTCRVRSAQAASAGTTAIVFKGVPAGTYAFAAFHDTNSNGRLDMAGRMPKESLAFSNDAMGSQGVPSFSSSAFKVTGNTQVTVKMRHVGPR